jgi:hypothetical protein
MKTTRVLLLRRLCARRRARVKQEIIETTADEQLIQRLTAVILDRDLQRVKAETLALETAMQRVKAENLALETALQRVKARTLALEIAQQMLRAEALETARVKCRRMN